MPQREAPDQDYRPSSVITLSIRFEDFSPPDAKAVKQAFEKPSIKMLGVRDSTAALVVIDDPSAPAGTLRKLVTFPGGSSKPAQDAVSSLDQFTFDLGGITPKNMVIGLNGARKAATMSATLRYLDAPLDPRTIRSCAVSAYLGTVTAEEFQAGINGQTRGSTNMPAHLCPPTYLDENGNQRTNLRFLGWVDSWESTWGADAEPLIRIECRDNVSLLDSQTHPPKMFIDASRPIHEAIAGYLANFSQMAGITVEYRPAGATPPSLAAALSKTAFRPNLGPSATGGGSSKTSSLDYLTDVTGALGLMLRVEGTNVVVQEVRSLVGAEFPPRPDDPYRPRDLPSGKTTVRRMVYGRNVAEMKCTRKYAKGTPTNIEIRCFDPHRKQVLVAHFPDEKNAKNALLVNKKPGDSAEQRWSVHRVSGITDLPTLQRIAQNYYEQQGRGEIEVEVKTRNLASFGGGDLDPDILDMQAGDSFELLVNRDDDELASVSKIEQLLLLQANGQQFMTNLGYDPDFTAAYIKSFTHLAFPTIFKLRHLGFSWDCDEGVALTMVGVNYVEVSADQRLPDGIEVQPAAGGTVARNQGP